MGNGRVDMTKMQGLAGSMTEQPADRQSGDKQVNRQYAVMEVEDPYAPGERITVTRQLRHDQLAWYHTHRQIDDAQYAAGRAYQRDYEAAERGARAIDPTKEAVDGGAAVDPLPVAQIAARNKLVAIEAILGHYLIRLLQAVLIHGASLSSMASLNNEAAKDHVGRMFRMGLELLAVQYGLSHKDYHKRKGGGA
jgi:hypothetical protein